jgi:uncharacterized protein (UPF0332 family)
MDLMIKNYINRSRNELVLADAINNISNKIDLKESLQIEDDMTFYSSVISHSYYAIFYSAKAILLTKGIKTQSPNIHKNTFNEFKENFVDNGILDVKLLEIYKKIVVRSDELLEVFKDEKWKRGNFTYNTIPQVNKEPAEDSLKNSKFFVSNIIKILEKI